MKRLLLAATAIGGAALIAPPAHAVLQFSLDINGATFNCVDNTACDTNAAVGVVQTGATTFNGVTFLGSSQTQLTGGTNELTTTSFQITNNNAASVNYQIAVGGTSFVGPVTEIQQTGSGSWTNAVGSNITMSYAASSANTQGANTPTDLPGTLLSTSPQFTAALPADSFLYDHTTPFVTAGLYSMTMDASGTLIAGGQLTGRAQSEIAINTPEPASLAILGAGLLGLGFVASRKRS
jgi:PEP-CTERM motif